MILQKLNFIGLAILIGTIALKTNAYAKTDQNNEVNEGFNNLNAVVYSSTGIGAVGITGSLIVGHNKKKRKMNEPSGEIKAE